MIKSEEDEQMKTRTKHFIVLYDEIFSPIKTIYPQTSYGK